MHIETRFYEYDENTKMIFDYKIRHEQKRFEDLMVFLMNSKQIEFIQMAHEFLIAKLQVECEYKQFKLSLPEKPEITNYQQFRMEAYKNAINTYSHTFNPEKLKEIVSKTSRDILEALIVDRLEVDRL